MRHDLSHSKLALVTTAGLHLRSDTPLSAILRGDASYRLLPATAKAQEIVQSHVSIGFDHTAIYRDLNVTLPIERLAGWSGRALLAAWRSSITPLWAPYATRVV